MNHVIRVAIPCLALAGCADDGQELVELDDVGSACVSDVEPSFGEVFDVDLQADAAAVVLVTFETCAAGCASEIETSCEATVNAGAVEVTGSASYLIATAPADCATICAFVQATCETPALGEGSWTLSYGGESEAFDVPWVGAAPCVGDLL